MIGTLPLRNAGSSSASLGAGLVHTLATILARLINSARHAAPALLNAAASDLVVLEVSPEQAYSALRSAKSAALLDVRSQAEWSFVGQPVLENGATAPVISVEWQSYPGMKANGNFLTDVQDALRANGLGPDCTLYVLCRSGARSRAAATSIIKAGLGQAINIAQGFEGDLDPATQQRGRISGWKAARLPWRQS